MQLPLKAKVRVAYERQARRITNRNNRFWLYTGIKPGLYALMLVGSLMWLGLTLGAEWVGKKIAQLRGPKLVNSYRQY